jgi:hypothetical protein
MIMCDACHKKCLRVEANSCAICRNDLCADCSKYRRLLESHNWANYCPKCWDRLCLIQDQLSICDLSTVEYLLGPLTPKIQRRR